MSKQFRRGDVVELEHDLRTTATLTVSHPVPHHINQPLELSIPAGAHAIVEKEKDGEVYLFFPAADDVETKRWVKKSYLKLVQ